MAFAIAPKTWSNADDGPAGGFQYRPRDEMIEVRLDE